MSSTTDKKNEEVVRISVRNLVEFILRCGDIDGGSSSTFDTKAMQMGSRLHRKIQSRMGSGYQAEVSLEGTFACDDFYIKVEGRADGIFEEEYEGKLLPTVDEIKGVMRDIHLIEEPVSVHLAQAKCYAYLYGAKEQLHAVGVRMSYGNLKSGEMTYFRFRYSFAELEEWFFSVLEEYRKWARYEREHRRIRQSSIAGVKFPFAYREGQKKLAGDVYRSICREKILFIQAPTGVGKTISTVFPAIMAMGQGKGEKIFYLTAKTIARTVAAEALDHLRGQGLRFKSVILTAKEKICKLDVPDCNPLSCPYAKGHYDRINDAVYALITSQDAFTRESIEQAAERYRVCPFELSLDLTLWVDGIIGDYNYVFHPRAKLKRFFGEGVGGDYLFLVDEAHNLIDRGRTMYSASLIKEDILELKKLVKVHSTRLARSLEKVNKAMLQMKRKTEEGGDSLTVLPSIDTFPVTVTNLYGSMEEFLENEADGVSKEVRDKVLERYFEIGTFLDTADRLDEHYTMYSQILPGGQFMVRLYCVDPSGRLQECMDKARSTILFSATFLPIGYYKKLLSSRTDNYAVYAKSCFDPGHCQVIIGRDTSSRYTQRTPEQYRRIAGYIRETVDAKKGNYLVFFSSYRMMEDVAIEYEAIKSPDTDLIMQTQGMLENEREAFLAEFTPDREHSLAGFCVMGSIFGEGIDLKEDRLIGSIIVGTGLPQVSGEVGLLKDYYDAHGMDGFRYAYQYPGMNKVLQAAGRVIRTEKDRGVVLLLDDRFAREEYQCMFPREWTQVKLVTLPRLKESLDAFWKETV